MRTSALARVGTASFLLFAAGLLGAAGPAAGAVLPPDAPPGDVPSPNGQAPAETVYFLVAEHLPRRHDSYVLPLNDPDDIAEARQWAALNSGPREPGRIGLVGPIVNARIAAGADGINGDYVAPDTRLWSWHMTEFLDFTRFGIELTDGSPTWVEQDVDGWIRNTRLNNPPGVGEIGFWGYTVAAELPGVPEPSAALVAAAGVLVLRPPRRGRAR